MSQIDEISVKRTRRSKEDKDLEQILSELGGDFKLEVYRFEPSWCDGQVGTFYIDAKSPLSVDDIRQRWGGRKIRVTVKRQDGDYVAVRTLTFPDPPRQDGVEIVPGPAGHPVRIDRLENSQKTQETAPAAPAPAAPTQDNSILKTLLELQSAQNTSMQNMLVNRVQHLESLLEARAPAEQFAGPAQIVSDNKPFDTLRDTIKMIQEMEQIRAVLGTPEQQAETSPWSGALEKMLDFVLEREKSAATMRQHQLLAAQNAPPLPPPAGGAVPSISDAQLVDLWQKRLAKVDPQTKAQILQAVLGDEIEEVIGYIPEPEGEDPENSENDTCAGSKIKVRSDLVSAEDRALLGDDATSKKNGDK